MNELIQKLRGWVETEAEHYTYRHFPDPKAEVDPLVPYGSYFRDFEHEFVKIRLGRGCVRPLCLPHPRQFFTRGVRTIPIRAMKSGSLVQACKERVQPNTSDGSRLLHRDSWGKGFSQQGILQLLEMGTRRHKDVQRPRT